jgi:hypothetical protein
MFKTGSIYNTTDTWWKQKKKQVQKKIWTMKANWKVGPKGQ